jgi:hypothetical protein
MKKISAKLIHCLALLGLGGGTLPIRGDESAPSPPTSAPPANGRPSADITAAAPGAADESGSTRPRKKKHKKKKKKGNPENSPAGGEAHPDAAGSTSGAPGN